MLGIPGTDTLLPLLNCELMLVNNPKEKEREGERERECVCVCRREGKKQGRESVCVCL